MCLLRSGSALGPLRFYYSSEPENSQMRGIPSGHLITGLPMITSNRSKLNSNALPECREGLQDPEWFSGSQRPWFPGGKISRHAIGRQFHSRLELRSRYPHPDKLDYVCSGVTVTGSQPDGSGE
ncbi:hypothetical protein NPIL_286351 [Nephila pilipes]|uniref:Uncharacterized protein n=1 Tax=Nephila pilipes TaxID=299642 RepID=A0A8X6R5B9_NEPPI|nr:hypothetical protein NPIL_286351 [Nephila pilipes]